MISGLFCQAAAFRCVFDAEHKKTRRKRYDACDELLGGFNLDIVAHLNFLRKLSYIKAFCKKENSFHFPYFGGRSRK